MRSCCRISRRRAMLASVVVFVLIAGNVLANAAPSQKASGQKNAPVLRDDMMGHVSASVLGESALVDQETGRILWEGGTTTLSASLAPMFESTSIKHVRATLLTGIFLLALIGGIVARIRQALFAESDNSKPWPMTALLFVADWTILRFPQVNSKVLIASILLYLLESYSCNTRRYLANALSSGAEVEEYIECLRKEPPVVSWRVRCYHYERRKWLSILKLLTLKREVVELDQGQSTAVQPGSWMFTRKIVTHQAVSNYNYTSCEDKTTAGLWRRAEATDATTAPFSKILLSKLLILPNAKARENYFKQQSTFVTREGRDEFTEFSTSIQVKGFRRRMLAVRPVEGVPSAKLFRLHLFWMFTLIGLTVPYRIWFARHCDELRVTVAKETSNAKTGSSSWSWFNKSTPKQSTKWNKEFKSKMRELALYAKGELLPLMESSNATTADVPSPPEGVNSTHVPPVIVNETEAIKVETNATQSDDGTKKEAKKEEEEPPPPTPPKQEGTAGTEEASDRQASTTDESSKDNSTL